MFLDTCKPFSKSVENAMLREYSNWLKISKVLYTTNDEETVLRILQLELMNKRRAQVISRVYSRFSAIRSDRETRDLKAFLADVEADSWSAELMKTWPDIRNTVDHFQLTLLGIKKMLKWEMLTLNRSYIKKRLYGMFRRRRMMQEHKEMKIWKVKR